jgi:alkylated DNA repair dioxygenase AlkB
MKFAKRKIERSQRPQESISSWLTETAAKRPKSTFSGGARPVTTCFICGLTIDMGFINLHLDTKCLKEHGPFDSKVSQREDRQKRSNSEINPEFYRDLRLQEHKSIPGLWFVYDFISEEEERLIIDELDLDRTPWKHSSFNGHCLSKTFGVKTQFGPSHIEERIVRANDPLKGEYDIPEYLSPYPERLSRLIRCHEDATLPATLRAFKPNECNANSYVKADGHYLTPHFDDRHLSGPILMNLSLGGHCRMTYTHAPGGTFSGASHDVIAVDLPPRCLQVISGDARYKYMHSIKAEDIVSDRRVSITWRQAGPANGGLIRGLKARPRDTK